MYICIYKEPVSLNRFIRSSFTMEFSSYFSSMWCNVKEMSQQILLPYSMNSKTHCGVSVKELKRELLRNLSQGQFNKKVKWALEELLIMQKIDYDCGNSKEFKSVITYIMNALRMFCIEEISPREVDTFLEISYLIKPYLSFFDLIRAISLMASAYKSDVCRTLLLMARNNNKNFKDTGNDTEDIELITQYISKMMTLDRENRVNDAIPREYCAFLLVQFYRRQLGLKPTENTLTNKQQRFTTRKEKVMRFENLWLRLLAICNLISYKNPQISKCVTLKKKFFEERAYFEDEILCLISAVESIYAAVRNITLSLNNNHFFDCEKALGIFTWVNNHCNIFEEEEEEEEKKEKTKDDTFWMKNEWKSVKRVATSGVDNDANRKRIKYE